MSSTAWLILTIVGALGSAACLYGIYGDKKRGYPALKAVDSQFEMPDMRFRYTPEELFACLEKLGTEGRQRLRRLWGLDSALALLLVLVLAVVSHNLAAFRWLRWAMYGLAVLRSLLDFLENGLLQYFADEVALSSLVFWTFGDLGSTDWQSLRGMALAVLLLIGYCYLHRWDYNALLSGEETALSLGIHVRRLTLTNVVLTCFVCSVIVSHVGLINFIGLVAPHIVRMVVGNNYIYLIPGSVLAGAALLLLSDLAARVIIMPVILPIGALTAFLGGPLFLYLLFKGRGRT